MKREKTCDLSFSTAFEMFRKHRKENVHQKLSATNFNFLFFRPLLSALKVGLRNSLFCRWKKKRNFAAVGFSFPRLLFKYLGPSTDVAELIVKAVTHLFYCKNRHSSRFTTHEKPINYRKKNSQVWGKIVRVHCLRVGLLLEKLRDSCNITQPRDKSFES